MSALIDYNHIINKKNFFSIVFMEIKFIYKKIFFNYLEVHPDLDLIQSYGFIVALVFSDEAFALVSYLYKFFPKCIPSEFYLLNV